MSERYLKNILKTLIVADLHFRENWFEWLINCAPAYDAVLIAGDLHDEVGPLNVRGGVPVYSWLTEAEDFPGLVTDGRTWVTEELILTSIPYCASDAGKFCLQPAHEDSHHGGPSLPGAMVPAVESCGGMGSSLHSRGPARHVQR
jgi:hypothetical protein